MPQARYEHANDGYFDVGPRLVKDQEIVARPGGSAGATTRPVQLSPGSAGIVASIAS